MSERIKLFSHCDMDGVACAILAKIAFGDKNVDVEYCNYDDINEKVREFYNSGRDREYYRVYITDISISDDLADEIDKYGCGNWFLFDHHGTATGLNRFGWCEVSVHNRNGLKTCGTELFYDELLLDRRFENKHHEFMVTLRHFVDVVRDWDTWRWKELSEAGEISKQLNDLLYIYGREGFINWVIQQVTIGWGKIIFNETDRALLANRQRSLEEYVNKKNSEMITYLDQFGKFCGIVFADRQISELGNRLSELHKELDYIALIDVAGRKVSYRTVRDDVDLGKEIAHAFGGGGHAKAAGSTFGEDVWYGIIGRLFTGVGVEEVCCEE